MATYAMDNATQKIFDELTLGEKVGLLSGTPHDFVSIAGLPEKGIPPLKVCFHAIFGIKLVQLIIDEYRLPIPSAESDPVASVTRYPQLAFQTQLA